MGPLDAQDRHRRLLEAVLQLTSEHSTEIILQRIVEIAAELTGARYAALGVIAPDGGSLSEFLTTGLTAEERAAIGPLPEGLGILGAIIHDPRPLRLAEISSDPRSVGFPPNHPPMHSFLGAPVASRGRVFGNLYLTEKQGAQEFTGADEETIVLLAAQAGVAIENARLFEANRRRERRLEVNREVANAILTNADAEKTLALVATRACELAGAEVTTISTLVDDGESMVIVAADGEGTKRLIGTKMPVTESLSGEVAAAGKLLVLDDTDAYPGLHRPSADVLPKIGPGIFVPLTAGGRVFGTMAVVRLARGSPAPFLQEEISATESLAGQAAVALEYGRTQEQLRRLAVLEDRERIARDLHDGAIQSLFAVGMSLQGTAALAEAAEVSARIGAAVGELDRVILELRNYIFGLRTEVSGEQLESTLHRLADEFQRRSGVVTVLDVDRDVAAELRGKADEVVHLTREALSNVGRHAQAATCRVSLVRHEGQALLEIDDDGRGFDPRVPSKGFGLRDLRERAAGLGGELEVRTTTGGGTCVRVFLPT
jgi:signal transduction histidine kinase